MWILPDKLHKQYSVSGLGHGKFEVGRSGDNQELDHTKQQRLEGLRDSKNRKKGRKEQIGSTPKGSRFLWPKGPGPDQYEWEEPRTLKPGVGMSAYGYNFREDLIRMYGNGVVEQVAELAWVDLWNKHMLK